MTPVMCLFCFITEKDFATHSGLSNLQDPDHKHSNLFNFCAFYRFFTLRAMYEVNRSPRPPLSLCKGMSYSIFDRGHIRAQPKQVLRRREKDDETTRSLIEEGGGQPKKFYDDRSTGSKPKPKYIHALQT